MHSITLYRAPGCWMARHSNPIVKEMFGAADIPTAWTDRADPEKVRQHIASLNPDCEVVIGNLDTHQEKGAQYGSRS